MKRFCFPSWLVYIIGAACLVAAFYGTYHYGFKHGDESVACAPDVEWDSWYMKCYNAAFTSGVMCPCNRDIEALGVCTAILDNNVFTQEEKRRKVEEHYGKEWASAFVPGQQGKKEDCTEQGICPAGKCVVWDGACLEGMEKYGYKQDSDQARKCCVGVIPE